MPSNDVFFVDQSEQSAVKAHIVSSYFSAWSRVIQKWNTPMAYIDLFCGPGKYENDKPSAPLLVVQNTLANPALLNRMNFVFNDKDPNNISMLKQAISQIDENSKLKARVQYYNETVEQDFYNRLRFLYNGIIIKHQKTEPTYTKTSLFLCEKRRFFMARREKGVVPIIYFEKERGKSF